MTPIVNMVIQDWKHQPWGSHPQQPGQEPDALLTDLGGRNPSAGLYFPKTSGGFRGHKIQSVKNWSITNETKIPPPGFEPGSHG